MAQGSGKTTFIVFIMFMMCLSSIVAAGGLYVTSKKEVDGTNLEIRSEATNIAVLPRPGNIVGRYNATSLKGTKWNDLSGKGNHITSEKIKGTLTTAEGFKGEYVKGTKDDGFTLPQKFENNHWSFFAVARYGSDVKDNQKRIFVSGETGNVDDETYDYNWLIGHYEGKTGVAHYGNPHKNANNKSVAWVTTQETVHGKRPWIRMVAQHNYFGTNGKPRTSGFSFDSDTQKKFNNPKSIGINVGQYMDTQSSDWNVYEILIYDTYLDGVDREKVDNYLKEKYILADLKSGISLTGGRPKLTDTVKLSTDDGKSEPWYGGKPRFGTQEDCRRFALELGYPQWGHYNEKHTEKDKINTCFFYGDKIVEIKDADTKVDRKTDGKTIEDMTFGCTQPYRNPKMNCEAGSGTGSNNLGGVAATASGAYCKAKKKLNDSVGLDWVQANVCGTHCTKDACMKTGEKFYYGEGGVSYDLTEFCEWNHTPHFEKFYNDELIKDVATNNNAEIPNKDEDGNTINYLKKHVDKCKDFKVQGAVEGVRYVEFKLPNSNHYVNIAEIEVYSAGVNIVKDFTADKVDISSQYSSATPANLLFDGIKTDDNMFHTSYSSVTNQYFKIDLGKKYAVDKVILFNRADDCGGCKTRWEGGVLKLYASDGTTVLKTGEQITSTDTAAGSKTYLF